MATRGGNNQLEMKFIAEIANVFAYRVSVFVYMLYLNSKVSVLLDTLVCGCQLFLPGSLICSRSNLSLGNKSYFVGKPNDAKALLEKIVSYHLKWSQVLKWINNI